MRRLFFGVSVLVAACSGSETTAPPAALPVDSVVIEGRTSMIVGDTVRLRIILYDGAHNQVSNRPLSIVSSDTKVATVDESGVVTALAEGYATITATSEGKKAETTLTILPPEGCGYHPWDYCIIAETFLLVSVNDQLLPVKSPYGVGEWDYDSDAGTWQLTMAMITLRTEGDFTYVTSHRAASGATIDSRFQGRYVRASDSIQFTAGNNSWIAAISGNTLIERLADGTKFIFARYVPDSGAWLR